MQRTRPILRGAKGYGWYNKYKAQPELFTKYASPTPFDWTVNLPAIPRPRVYFDLSTNNEPIGRIVFELASDIVPKTVDNFLRLVTGDNKHNFSYKDTKFHRVRKGEIIMGGDVEMKNGLGSHSATESRYIRDENYIIPHSARGLLRYM